MIIKLKDIISEGTKTVSALYPEMEAREMVLAYLEHRLGTTRHTHIIDPSYEVPGPACDDIRAAFAAMASGVPVQYVTGKSYFYGRRFNVSPSVLIPRPETELLCREVMNARTSGRIIDLCTGSGCIAWTLALEMPGTEVTGVDISDDALMVAAGQDFSEEMKSSGALAPSFVKADVLGSPSDELGQFDVLASNPPYVMESEKALMRKNVLEHEPHLALFVSDEDPLLFYRAVGQWAIALLKPGGFGIVEINEALAPETERVFRDLHFRNVRTVKDLNEKDRFVVFER